MDRKIVLTGAALAALAAAGCRTCLTCEAKPKSASNGPAAPAPVAKGECWGVNACNGKGACGGVGHSCAGENSCKGKGWLSLSKAECDAQKGQFKAQ